MDTDQIMSAIFLIAVLILILPNFLSTNNKLKEFLSSKGISTIINYPSAFALESFWKK